MNKYFIIYILIFFIIFVIGFILYKPNIYQNLRFLKETFGGTTQTSKPLNNYDIIDNEVNNIKKIINNEQTINDILCKDSSGTPKKCSKDVFKFINDTILKYKNVTNNDYKEYSESINEHYKLAYKKYNISTPLFITEFKNFTTSGALGDPKINGGIIVVKTTPVVKTTEGFQDNKILSIESLYYVFLEHYTTFLFNPNNKKDVSKMKTDSSELYEYEYYRVRIKFLLFYINFFYLKIIEEDKERGINYLKSITSKIDGVRKIIKTIKRFNKPNSNPIFTLDTETFFDNNLLNVDYSDKIEKYIKDGVKFIDELIKPIIPTSVTAAVNFKANTARNVVDKIKNWKYVLVKKEEKLTIDFYTIKIETIIKQKKIELLKPKLVIIDKVNNEYHNNILELIKQLDFYNIKPNTPTPSSKPPEANMADLKNALNIIIDNCKGIYNDKMTIIDNMLKAETNREKIDIENIFSSKDNSSVTTSSGSKMLYMISPPPPPWNDEEAAERIKKIESISSNINNTNQTTQIGKTTQTTKAPTSMEKINSAFNEIEELNNKLKIYITKKIDIIDKTINLDDNINFNKESDGGSKIFEELKREFTKYSGTTTATGGTTTATGGTTTATGGTTTATGGTTTATGGKNFISYLNGNTSIPDSTNLDAVLDKYRKMRKRMTCFVRSTNSVTNESKPTNGFLLPELNANSMDNSLLCESITGLPKEIEKTKKTCNYYNPRCIWNDNKKRCENKNNKCLFLGKNECMKNRTIMVSEKYYGNITKMVPNIDNRYKCKWVSYREKDRFGGSPGYIGNTNSVDSKKYDGDDGICIDSEMKVPCNYYNESKECIKHKKYCDWDERKTKSIYDKTCGCSPKDGVKSILNKCLFRNKTCEKDYKENKVNNCKYYNIKSDIGPTRQICAKKYQTCNDLTGLDPSICEDNDSICELNINSGKKNTCKEKELYNYNNLALNKFASDYKPTQNTFESILQNLSNNKNHSIVETLPIMGYISDIESIVNNEYIIKTYSLVDNISKNDYLQIIDSNNKYEKLKILDIKRELHTNTIIVSGLDDTSVDNIKLGLGKNNINKLVMWAVIRREKDIIQSIKIFKNILLKKELNKKIF